MTIEIVHCGGCERPSLLEDVEAAGDYEETSIDEPHCPRCGTRLEYDGTTVETYSADGGQPDDVHWIRPESLTKFDMVAAALLDRLADAGGTATLDDLSRGDFETGAATSRIQALFELDVVHYELDQNDPGATEVELAHETIRVMPLIVDGERPSMRDVLADSLGNDVVPEGVLEDAE